MPSPEQIYSGSVRVLSVAFIAIGVALIVATLGAGGGPASVGLLMGIGFIAVGGGRLWMASRGRT
jgi:hypothetical protein